VLSAALLLDFSNKAFLQQNRQITLSWLKRDFTIFNSLKSLFSLVFYSEKGLLNLLGHAFAITNAEIYSSLIRLFVFNRSTVIADQLEFIRQLVSF
jgi:hypothetical protein